MAQYRGTFPARGLTPAPFGLLSVADVATPGSRDYNDHFLWGDEYNVLYNSNPQTVRVISPNNATPDADNLVYSSGQANIYYDTFTPFYIQVEDKSSGLGYTADDHFARLRAQLESVTQKAVEYEFWEGVSADEMSSPGPYLTKTGGADILTTAGANPKAALYLLEQAIADSPTGSGGVLHFTRDVASVLSLSGSFVKVGDQLFTALGTPVVVGSGYTGSGPNGETDEEPTDTNKWAYVTGPVNVILGESKIVNEDIARGFTPASNDVFLKAERPASVHFDPTIFAAAQITLPAAP